MDQIKNKHTTQSSSSSSASSTIQSAIDQLNSFPSSSSTTNAPQSTNHTNTTTNTTTPSSLSSIDSTLNALDGLDQQFPFSDGRARPHPSSLPTATTSSTQSAKNAALAQQLGSFGSLGSPGLGHTYNPLTHWGQNAFRNPYATYGAPRTAAKSNDTSKSANPRKKSYEDKMDKQRLEHILFSGDSLTTPLNQQKERMRQKLQQKKKGKKKHKNRHKKTQSLPNGNSSHALLGYDAAKKQKANGDNGFYLTEINSTKKPNKNEVKNQKKRPKNRGNQRKNNRRKKTQRKQSKKQTKPKNSKNKDRDNSKNPQSPKDHKIDSNHTHNSKERDINTKTESDKTDNANIDRMNSAYGEQANPANHSYTDPQDSLSFLNKQDTIFEAVDNEYPDEYFKRHDITPLMQNKLKLEYNQNIPGISLWRDKKELEPLLQSNASNGYNDYHTNKNPHLLSPNDKSNHIAGVSDEDIESDPFVDNFVNVGDSDNDNEGTIIKHTDSNSNDSDVGIEIYIDPNEREEIRKHEREEPGCENGYQYEGINSNVELMKYEDERRNSVIDIGRSATAHCDGGTVEEKCEEMPGTDKGKEEDGVEFNAQGVERKPEVAYVDEDEDMFADMQIQGDMEYNKQLKEKESKEVKGETVVVNMGAALNKVLVNMNIHKSKSATEEEREKEEIEKKKNGLGLNEKWAKIKSEIKSNDEGVKRNSIKKEGKDRRGKRKGKGKNGGDSKRNDKKSNKIGKGEKNKGKKEKKKSKNNNNKSHAQTNVSEPKEEIVQPISIEMKVMNTHRTITTAETAKMEKDKPEKSEKPKKSDKSKPKHNKKKEKNENKKRKKRAKKKKNKQNKSKDTQPQLPNEKDNEPSDDDTVTIDSSSNAPSSVPDNDDTNVENDQGWITKGPKNNKKNNKRSNRNPQSKPSPIAKVTSPHTPSNKKAQFAYTADMEVKPKNDTQTPKNDNKKKGKKHKDNNERHNHKKPQVKKAKSSDTHHHNKHHKSRLKNRKERRRMRQKSDPNLLPSSTIIVPPEHRKTIHPSMILPKASNISPAKSDQTRHKGPPYRPKPHFAGDQAIMNKSKNGKPQRKSNPNIKLNLSVVSPNTNRSTTPKSDTETSKRRRKPPITRLQPRNTIDISTTPPASASANAVTLPSTNPVMSVSQSETKTNDKIVKKAMQSTKPPLLGQRSAPLTISPSEKSENITQTSNTKIEIENNECVHEPLTASQIPPVLPPTQNSNSLIASTNGNATHMALYLDESGNLHETPLTLPDIFPNGLAPTSIPSVVPTLGTALGATVTLPAMATNITHTPTADGNEEDKDGNSIVAPTVPMFTLPSTLSLGNFMPNLSNLSGVVGLPTAVPMPPLPGVPPLNTIPHTIPILLPMPQFTPAQMATLSENLQNNTTLTAEKTKTKTKTSTPLKPTVAHFKPSKSKAKLEDIKEEDEHEHIDSPVDNESDASNDRTPLIAPYEAPKSEMECLETFRNDLNKEETEDEWVEIADLDSTIYPATLWCLNVKSFQAHPQCSLKKLQQSMASALLSS